MKDLNIELKKWLPTFHYGYESRKVFISDSAEPIYSTTLDAPAVAPLSLIKIQNGIATTTDGTHLFTYPISELISEETFNSISINASKIEEALLIALDDFDVTYLKASDYLVTTYFPKITITNEEDDSHVIHDLYVRFKVTIERGYIQISNIKGQRGAATIGEVQSGYLHSHLNTGYGSAEFKNFCLGEGSDSLGTLSRNISTLSIEEGFEALTGFGLALNDFVGWESLHGGPYINITNIQGSRTTECTKNSSHSEDIDKLFAIYAENASDIPYTLVPDIITGKSINPEVDFTALELQAYSIFKSAIPKPEFDRIIASKYPNGTYRTGSLETGIPSGVKRLMESEMFKYKRNSVKFKIIEEKLTEDFTLKPQITEALRLKINKELLKHFKNEY